MTDSSESDLQPLLDKNDPSRDSDNTKHNNNNNNSNSDKTAKKKINGKVCKDINRNVVVTDQRKLSFSRKSQLKFRYIWKRKPFLYLLAIAVLIFLVNLTYNRSVEDDLMGSDDDLYFINHLHSHVPGMKGKKHSLFDIKIWQWRIIF